MAWPDIRVLRGAPNLHCRRSNGRERSSREVPASLLGRSRSTPLPPSGIQTARMQAPRTRTEITDRFADVERRRDPWSARSVPIAVVRLLVRYDRRAEIHDEAFLALGAASSAPEGSGRQCDWRSGETSDEGSEGVAPDRCLVAVVDEAAEFDGCQCSPSSKPQTKTPPASTSPAATSPRQPAEATAAADRDPTASLAQAPHADRRHGHSAGGRAVGRQHARLAAVGGAGGYGPSGHRARGRPRKRPAKLCEVQHPAGPPPLKVERSMAWAAGQPAADRSL
jgi:hypothetical protein